MTGERKMTAVAYFETNNEADSEVVNNTYI